MWTRNRSLPRAPTVEAFFSYHLATLQPTLPMSRRLGCQSVRKGKEEEIFVVVFWISKQVAWHWHFASRPCTATLFREPVKFHIVYLPLPLNHLLSGMGGPDILLGCLYVSLCRGGIQTPDSRKQITAIKCRKWMFLVPKVWLLKPLRQRPLQGSFECCATRDHGGIFLLFPYLSFCSLVITVAEHLKTKSSWKWGLKQQNLGFYQRSFIDVWTVVKDFRGCVPINN